MKRMLLTFIAAALLLSLGDIKELREKKEKRELVVYAGLMIAAVALMIWYLSNSYNRSISDMIMSLFNIRG